MLRNRINYNIMAQGRYSILFQRNNTFFNSKNDSHESLIKVENADIIFFFNNYLCLSVSTY